MRAFVGAPLDPAHRQALSLGADALRDTDPTWRGEKWVPVENLHITLQFLGELSAESVDELATDLARRLTEIPPAEVGFDTDESAAARRTRTDGSGRSSLTPRAAWRPLRQP